MTKQSGELVHTTHPHILARRQHSHLIGLIFSTLVLFLVVARLFDVYYPEVAIIQAIALSIMYVCMYVLWAYVSVTARGHLALLHVGMLTLYHGISEVLASGWLSERGIRYATRAGLSTSETAHAALIASIGIVFFVLGYFFLRKSGSNRGGHLDSRAGNDKQHGLDSINLLVLSVWVGLIFLYRTSYFEPQSSLVVYVSDALFRYLSLPVLVIFFIRLAILFREKGLNTWLYWVGVIVFSALMTLIGNFRADQLYLIIAIVLMLWRWRLMSIRPYLITVLIMSFLVSSSLLIVVRNAVGRDAILSSNFHDRRSLIQSSVSEFDISSLEGVQGDLSYRFRGNLALGGLIKNRNQNDLYPDPFLFSLYLMIPSPLWPDKYDQVTLSRGGYLSSQFGLAHVDYLITPQTVFYAVGGTTMMMIFMFLTGVFVRALDDYISATNNVVSAIVGVCAFIGLAQVEKDLAGWVLNLRNVILLLLVFSLVKLIKPLISLSHRYV